MFIVRDPNYCVLQTSSAIPVPEHLQFVVSASLWRDYRCHGKFQTSLRILRWSKFALNLLSYPFLNHSILSQIKKVDEELNCFYSDVLNFKVLMKGLLCVFNSYYQSLISGK